MFEEMGFVFVTMVMGIFQLGMLLLESEIGLSD